MPDQRPSRIAIAGGTGGLGRQLVSRLSARYQVVSIGRSEGKRESPWAAADPGQWMWTAELTELPEAEVALAGAEQVVFAAKTNRPPGRLTQASTDDLDTLLADTVARAAQLCGAKRIICPEEAGQPVLSALRSGVVPVDTVAGGAEAIARHLEGAPTDAAMPASMAPAEKKKKKRAKPASRAVVSVQRSVRPPGWSAEDVAFAYLSWLPSVMPGLSVQRVASSVAIRFAGVTMLHLVRSAGKSRPDSCWFEVADGALVRREESVGRLEFRALLGGAEVLAVLDDFLPSLPWPVYRMTQAVAHVAIMRRFGRWLAQASGGDVKLGVSP